MCSSASAARQPGTSAHERAKPDLLQSHFSAHVLENTWADVNMNKLAPIQRDVHHRGLHVRLAERQRRRRRPASSILAIQTCVRCPLWCRLCSRRRRGCGGSCRRRRRRAVVVG